MVPNVDSFGLSLKKTFPSMIFHDKRIRFTLPLRSKLFKNPKFAGKFGKLPSPVTKWAVLDTLLYFTNSSITTKSGFRPF